MSLGSRLEALESRVNQLLEGSHGPNTKYTRHGTFEMQRSASKTVSCKSRGLSD